MCTVISIIICSAFYAWRNWTQIRNMEPINSFVKYHRIINHRITSHHFHFFSSLYFVFFLNLATTKSILYCRIFQKISLQKLTYTDHREVAFGHSSEDHLSNDRWRMPELPTWTPHFNSAHVEYTCRPCLCQVRGLPCNSVAFPNWAIRLRKAYVAFLQERDPSCMYSGKWLADYKVQKKKHVMLQIMFWIITVRNAAVLTLWPGYVITSRHCFL